MLHEPPWEVEKYNEYEYHKDKDPSYVGCIMTKNRTSDDIGGLEDWVVTTNLENAYFFVDAVNGKSTQVPPGLKLPLHTRPCFDELENGKACWCREIYDGENNEIIEYGNINKEDADLIVRSVNKYVQ
jgi:hypothetical protein